MNLCIDVGNTRIKIGIYKDQVMVHHDAFLNVDTEYIEKIFTQFPIQKAISSSTRKHITTFEKNISKKVSLLRLDHNTPIPITNEYTTPQTLGKDRLAAVIGCTRHYPNQACLVIDAGTCITYDILTSDGRYLGGNISPGLQMRANAMDTMTSTLPIVDIIYNEDYIGKSTETAMQNGIVYGTLLEIESFIALIKRDFGDINTIITGGNAEFFGNHLKSCIFAHSFLVLDGLDTIINHNAV